MKRSSRIGILTVNHLGLCVGVQLGLAFGLAALFWPDKFMPLFEILMFPWAASYRLIRANGIAAIGFSLLLLAMRLSGNR
ncbi:hypothetical protein SBA1_1870005 [Candidatus Sulfotelmatobacter kueseliae]|jgi:hypothetical protein|uniref:Uncharacterized protein n=1 Tax=Candidatus Sulfotelmatobacter kueseliae TaxID=2042962 RepID=A0A2U3KDU1_9BACT|nr:hypothetical protein SBA1_1870005 [Candidatus Sulfotelmatobacter kueseliae]